MTGEESVSGDDTCKQTGADTGDATTDTGEEIGDDHGYRHVAVDDVPNTPNPTRAKRELDEAVGASLFGCNYYEADPGERVPWGYHRHPDHEELFYVIAGDLAVETPERTYRVGADEAFFVPRDAPNRAVAVGDEPCRFLAVGAPKDADAAVISEPCPECGAETDREYEVESGESGATEDGAASEREVYVLWCGECGAETDRFSG